MDEPQLTCEISEVDPVAEKSDINEILHSGFEIVKSIEGMEVDDEANIQPGTSSNIQNVDDLTGDIETAHAISPDMLGEETNIEKDVSMAELTSETTNVSIEQVQFQSPSDEMDVTAQSPTDQLDVTAQSPSDELDVTAQSDIADLDFTEASVNISQLDVENHDDDSNDAFNALKQSETDALQEPKEEQEEGKDEEKNIEDKSDEPAPETADSAENEPSVSAETQMETDDLPADALEPDVSEIETEATDVADTEILQEQISQDNAESREVEEMPEGE